MCILYHRHQRGEDSAKVDEVDERSGALGVREFHPLVERVQLELIIK